MSSNKEWMYTMRATNNGFLHPEFDYHLTSFLDFAFANAHNIERRIIDGKEVLKIRCPCSKCKNKFYKTRELVEYDIFCNGFMPDYYLWYAHGESHYIPSQQVGQCSNPTPSQHVGRCSNPVDYDPYEPGEYDGCDQMVMESMHQNHVPQDPNLIARTFYDMLEDANEPLWDGCQNYSKLSAATTLLNWKSDCNVSDSTYNKILPIIKGMLPDGEKLPGNFYETKKMLKLLQLPKEKIHACKNHCMLFYKEYSHLDHCRVCLTRRYKDGMSKVPNLVLTYVPIGPRLQRLFYSKKTAKHMTWHSDHQREQGKMIHPSDGEAWKHFDTTFPEFAKETRNVRIGLSTDGFNPNNSNSSPYSCWPVFITIYNLPPWLALKDGYVKMPLLIPGGKNPGQNLDVFLQPLIEELKLLFDNGIETYDAYQRNNFQMRVVLLWTISDFPAYAMLSGWSTHGKLACPYCTDKAGSFQLHFGQKPCWFDCHRKHLPKRHSFRKDKINFLKNKRESVVTPIPEPSGDQIWQTIRLFPTVYQGRPYHPDNTKLNGFGDTHNWVKRSIFWELPYWRKLLIRHNLDVMHIEKNVFDNLFHTIMGTPKSKDNLKARKDIERYCDRPSLNLIPDNGKLYKQDGAYTLKRKAGSNEVHKVCEWLKKLKFPDGYASNIGNCVNTQTDSFYAFKSHDCHVFMQRLLPLAIRGFVSNEIYDAVTELCMFFRALCSKILHLDDLNDMKHTIVQTVCKLEKIFPPGFFDSMEHLIIHLAHEAIIGGPVQYRWMYLFERKLGLIKRTIRNKARVEGSIVESYLVNELAGYCSLYFESSIETRHNREPRNFAPEHPIFSSTDSRLSVFVFMSRRLFTKGGTRRLMDEQELHKAHTYILLNCVEVHPYVYMFDELVREEYPNEPNEPLQSLRDRYFADWFEKHVMMESNESTNPLKAIARRPSRHVKSHKGYFVNGYKFHTQRHGDRHITNNCGVCVRGTTYNDEESDYYGLLDEVLEVNYLGSGRCIVVLFKCTWFDHIHGVKVNKHKLVDIKPKSRLQSDDPFVLASQVEQVYYTPYPAVTRDTKDWWAAIKTKPRGIYEVSESVSEVVNDENIEAEQFFHIDERFEYTNEVSNNERMNLVTDGEFHAFDTDEVRTEVEEEEFQEFYDTDEYEDELVLSDHSSDSDEDEVDL